MIRESEILRRVAGRGELCRRYGNERTMLECVLTRPLFLSEQSVQERHGLRPEKRRLSGLEGGSKTKEFGACGWEANNKVVYSKDMNSSHRHQQVLEQEGSELPFLRLQYARSS